MRAGPAKASALPRLLITGFGHFPGMPANPSAQLARQLARRRPAGGARTEERLLATRWDEAAGFPALLAQTQPDIVLMLGVAARRRRVSIEIVGRNATGAFPDAAGYRPASGVLEPGAPAQRALAARPAPLLAALRAAGVPAHLSRHAGRYVCNALAFRAYGWARAGRRTDGGPRLAVLVHVPLPRPGRLALPQLARGLEALLAALLAQFRQSRLRA
ncbi:peptidase C15 [Ancylobacter polymorphus]|uniref:Pyrrolidone-carboxylate peptidase n=1 Tax=Ancylobacter polymorphus TaxID=223390 RepID=A0A9E6ZSV7_9HYPH|nr:peptidase C15 [Ancylobacter polymorphus]UOK71096.1 peptidase C15 [Ancylobacter polymorphus]